MPPERMIFVHCVLTLDRFEALVPVAPRAGRLLLAYATLLAIGAAVTSG